jgi:hypothetical protein
LPQFGAGDERVADLQRSALDEHGDDRAAARVELGLDDDAGGVRRRVGPQLSTSAMTLIVSSRSSRPGLRLGGDVDELDLAAPLDRLEALRRHLRADTGRVGALLVDLVDRDEHRDLRRLGVVDGLLGLRLHAVVGRDHDDRDVGDARAAGAHGGERLVARGVEEGDRLAALVDLVGADVLGDAAGLAATTSVCGSRRAATSCRGRRGP